MDFALKNRNLRFSVASSIFRLNISKRKGLGIFSRADFMDFAFKNVTVRSTVVSLSPIFRLNISKRKGLLCLSK